MYIKYLGQCPGLQNFKGSKTCAGSLPFCLQTHNPASSTQFYVPGSFAWAPCPLLPAVFSQGVVRGPGEKGSGVLIPRLPPRWTTTRQVPPAEAAASDWASPSQSCSPLLWNPLPLPLQEPLASSCCSCQAVLPRLVSSAIPALPLMQSLHKTLQFPIRMSHLLPAATMAGVKP